ncbi:MAG: GNAT family N-acetyltransferase [Tannerellaceae bacterium]|nr:GNAT family N-acetyltransferase [Tannerellaceae bacterium]
MKIRLRTWRIEDIPLLARQANNPRIACNLTDGFPHPYTEEDAERFIRMTMQTEPALFFAITVDDELAGSISLSPQTDIHCKNAELGYFLAEEYWGRGYMTEAVRQIVAYGFETLDITRIFARPFGRNRASQRVLEKAGFTLEACFKNTLYKNGDYLDEMVYGIRGNQSQLS